MNKIIARILIAAMVFTTVITPIEFGFAETGAVDQASQQNVSGQASDAEESD